MKNVWSILFEHKYFFKQFKQKHIMGYLEKNEKILILICKG
jgi:hypothetical protein